MASWQNATVDNGTIQKILNLTNAEDVVEIVNNLPLNSRWGAEKLYHALGDKVRQTLSAWIAYPGTRTLATTIRGTDSIFVENVGDKTGAPVLIEEDVWIVIGPATIGGMNTLDPNYHRIMPRGNSTRSVFSGEVYLARRDRRYSSSVKPALWSVWKLN